MQTIKLTEIVKAGLEKYIVREFSGLRDHLILTVSETPITHECRETIDYVIYCAVEEVLTGNGCYEEYCDDSDEEYAAQGIDLDQNRISAVAVEAKVNGEKLELRVIHEEEKPQYNSCPPEILEQLTTTENKNALEWRAACENHYYFFHR